MLVVSERALNRPSTEASARWRVAYQGEPLVMGDEVLFSPCAAPAVFSTSGGKRTSLNVSSQFYTSTLLDMRSVEENPRCLSGGISLT